MDLSKVSRSEVYGAVAALILLATLLFLNWYGLTETDARVNEGIDFICGDDNYSCTGFATFPILRWLLVLACSAPLVLAWILARGHKLSWAPGEMTMVVGFAAFVLIAYNGILDKPGKVGAEIGVTLEPGYFIALAASIGIAASGVLRLMESQKGNLRKAPGTV